ncbi:hypothetical protein ACLRDC_05635 [Gluconacetobacter sacchari]|uniref:hypothetical protein n=1 Tax=Gluconacetobacter sacchari TaxID=92759 RepID=UPI0039B5CFA3
MIRVIVHGEAPGAAPPRHADATSAWVRERRKGTVKDEMKRFLCIRSGTGITFERADPADARTGMGMTAGMTTDKIFQTFSKS